MFESTKQKYMLFSELQTRIQRAKTLDFGTIFNQSIELFKKVWVQGLVLQLLILVIMLPFMFLFYMPFIAVMIEQSQSGYVDPDALNEVFYGRGPFFILIFYLIIFLLSAVSALLYAGFYRIVKKVDFQKEFQFSEFFYYFNGNYFVKGFFLMMMATIISFFAALLCVLPIFYVMVPIMFFIPIFAFNPELSIGNIMTLAFNLGNKKWGITFGLLIVCWIVIFVVSIITCGLGSLFLTSFIYLPVYIIYKEVIGFDGSNDDGDVQKIENL